MKETVSRGFSRDCGTVIADFQAAHVLRYHHILGTLNPELFTSNMHTQDTIEQCLQLRADGKTYQHIAQELNVSFASVARWSREHKARIHTLRAARLETLHEQYLGRYEDKLSDMAHEVAAINTELKLRDFGDVSTEFLLYRKTCLQARMERLAARQTETLKDEPPPAEDLPGLQPTDPK